MWLLLGERSRKQVQQRRSLHMATQLYPRHLGRAIKHKLKTINSSPLNTTALVPFVKAPILFQQVYLVMPVTGRRTLTCQSIAQMGLVFGFPYEVCATTLRVDAYIISRASKTCIAGPEWKRILVSGTRSRLTNIILFAAKDWRVHTLTLEVGARGFIPPSFRTCLRKLGFTFPEIKNLSNACSLMAQKCSYVIWINRQIKFINPFKR